MSKRHSILMLLGVILIVGALALQLYNSWDDQRAGNIAVKDASALIKNISQLQENTEDTEWNMNSDMDSVKDMETMFINGNEYIGIISIPDMDVMLPVLSTWSYPLLQIAPCLYEGNYKENSMIIAAHNYKSHFGKLSNLKSGAKIQFTSTEGVLYEYRVSQIEILEGTEVKKMKQGEYDLTLFTCTYGGESRVTVRCIAK